MADYDKFAKNYSDSMSEEGDYFHKKHIDPAIYSIVGNVKNKTVYDIGCGNGYMARNFVRQGAKKVYASDISSELIKIAKEKSKGLDIHYSVHKGEDFEGYQANYFDVVTMNMVIHYIKDIDKLFKGISEILKVNGVFVFSTGHFFRPDYPYSEFVEGKLYGKGKLFIKVTNYLETYEVHPLSWWDNKTKLTIYNRPLNKFVDGLVKHSLYLFKVIEPETPEFPHSFETKLRGTDHIPTFIIFGAMKK